MSTFLCNEDGLDPISYGATVAAAMELFEEGVITTKETGGVELTFGNAEAFVAITEANVQRRRFRRGPRPRLEAA